MIKLGEKQTLTIVKKVEFGVYLAPSKEEGQSIVTGQAGAGGRGNR